MLNKHVYIPKFARISDEVCKKCGVNREQQAVVGGEDFNPLARWSKIKTYTEVKRLTWRGIKTYKLCICGYKEKHNG